MSIAAPGRQRIKILVVSEPGFAGVKRHVVELLSHIDVSRFEICFIYSLARADETYASEIERLRERGVRCVEVPMGRGIHPWLDLVALVRIARVVADFRPAIVHGHSSKAGFLARVASRLVGSGARTLYSPHAMSCEFSKVFWFLEVLAGLLTDCLIAVSPSEAADFKKWRIPAGRVATVPLNARHPDEYPARKKRPDGRLLVAACGRISRQKNGLLFFKTAVEVMRAHPDVRFRWIGSFDEDAEAAEVRRFIASEPLTANIEITGWVKDADALIAEADIFCILSRYESFGYVAADAMMMSLPVVASRVTGLVDLVVDGETGFLCQATPGSVTPALERLIQSPELRSRMGAAGRARMLKEFSLHNTIRNMEDLYQQMSGRGPAPRIPNDSRAKSAKSMALTV